MVSSTWKPRSGSCALSSLASPYPNRESSCTIITVFAGWPDQIRLAFFVGISLLALGIVVSFFRRLAPGDRLSALALGFISGGAVGNLIDRVARHEVVDFLHFKLWQGYSWPDFNFADSFIVVGVGLLVLELLASEGESRAGAEGDEPLT